MKKNIVLIGMMGSGKTTVGKILPEKLINFKFVDIDELIEFKENRSINNIFSTDGESYFRDLESAMVKELSSLNSLIISTGGGVVKKTGNIKVLKDNGILFYLATSPDTIVNRIKDNSDRPLLNVSNMQTTVDNLLNERVNLYKAADYEIDTNSKSPEKIADEIIEIYKNHE